MLLQNSAYKNMRCVYCIRCVLNNSVYVGQTCNMSRRLREHVRSLSLGEHRNKRLQADYDKFGADSFVLEIISSNPENLDLIEQNEIDRARDSVLCYNVFSGGRVGYRGDDEFRRKMSAAHKGRVVSEKTRRIKSEIAKRQWQNKEYRNRMVESATAQWRNDEFRKAVAKSHVGNPEACGHKLTTDIVIKAIEEYRCGAKISDLAEKYGVAYYTIHSAITGKSWKNIDR